MNSPVFNALNASNAPINPTLMQKVQMFNEFRKTFSGNPEQMGMKLLRTGRMSQAEFDAIVPQANEIYNLINR